MTLPQPGDAFAWTDAFERAALVCRPLAPFAQHLFTSRLWPIGTPSGAGAEESWDGIAHALGADRSRLLSARQAVGASAPRKPPRPALTLMIATTEALISPAPG